MTAPTSHDCVKGWGRRTVLLLLLFATSGCTTGVRRYFEQGWMVGFDYLTPTAPVAVDWIDADDQRVATDRDSTTAWWTAFNDPILDELIQRAYCQNLTLRQAGFRIIQATAMRNIRVGNFYPQQQGATGDYQHDSYSRNRANTSFIKHQFYNQFDIGFSLAWELDFWGRFRRGIEAADADLDASVHEFEDVLVTLIGETAGAYIEIRIYQKAIALTKQNVELQRQTYNLANARFIEGATSELDVDQGMANLSRSESAIPDLEVSLRSSVLQLCTLLGIPPEDLIKTIGEGEIPTAPPELAIGIPAQLLCRRPDIRRVERQCAAQCARIGVAESELYPHIALAGSVGYSSQSLNNILASPSFMSGISPEFQWALLNYGRLTNAVMQNDARLKELIAAYQQTVLVAQQEVETGLVLHIKSWKRAEHLNAAVRASQKAVVISLEQFSEGAVDFNRVVLVEQNLMEQQIEEVKANGNIALGMVQTFKALGGGWEIGATETDDLRCTEPDLHDRAIDCEP